MNHSNFICLACEKDLQSASNLNKHLYSCETYPEWIKTYTPPSTVDCQVCDKKFTNQNDLNNHHMHYCKKC